MFAERLKKAIDERGWSLNQAGRYLGVSGKQISRYLSGAQPTLPVAKRLAERLRISIDELAGHETPTPRPREVTVLVDGEAWTARRVAAGRPVGEQMASAEEAVEEVSPQSGSSEEGTGN